MFRKFIRRNDLMPGQLQTRGSPINLDDTLQLTSGPPYIPEPTLGVVTDSLFVTPIGQSNSQSLPEIAGNVIQLQNNAFNFAPLNLQQSRKFMGESLLGLSRFRIGYVGDSTTAGVHSGTLTFAQTKPSVFASRLNAAGIPARTDNVYLPPAVVSVQGSTTFPTETRVTLTGTWTLLQQNLPSGNVRQELLVQSTVAGSTLTFTPVGTVNSLDIWYYGGQAAAFTAQVNGETATDITQVFNGAWQKTTISAPAGVNTLTITLTSGSANLGFIEGYNTAVTDISVLNLGISGIASTEATEMYGTGFNGGTLWQALQCNTYILNLGINDMLFGIEPSVTNQNLQTLITNLKANGGDLIIEVPNPVQSNDLENPTVGIPIQLAFEASVIALATENALCCIDLYGRFGGYEVANALGFIGVDHIHPTNLGYNDIGRFEFESFRNIVSF